MDTVQKFQKRFEDIKEKIIQSLGKDAFTPAGELKKQFKDTLLGNGRKYLFILGEKDGKDISIVWREYNDNWDEDDFKKDKEFIIKELEPWEPQIVYINGQSVLTPKPGNHNVEIRYIEPEFKRLIG